MKRFVLSCCILAVTSTMVFAQAAKTSITNSTSQTKKTTNAEFIAKVNAFEAGVTRDNKPAANQNFEDLKQIMTADLHSIKPKIVNAPNAAEKSKWTDVMTKKQNIYFEIINAASDMRGNVNVMVKKYKEYAATL